MSLILPSQEPYPGAPYQRDELLHELFAETAGRFPERIAVRLAEPNPESPRRNSWTYSELRQRASRFARYLMGRGVKRGDRVVICLPRGLDQYMVILGVLEAGAAYVPVDWEFPQDRAEYIAQESEAAMVVTRRERGEAFRKAGCQVIEIYGELGDIAAEDATPVSRAETGAKPSDPAYLIYTSGSTGRPKGAIIRHSNAAFQSRAYASILGITYEDRVYAGASLAFDISIEEMWGAFLAGAELLIGSEALVKAGPDLALTLAREQVTVWCPVPSLLAVIEEDIPSLRLLDVGGEACPPELVRRWVRPGRRFLNTYGPTETTVSATWKELGPGQSVTIGQPLPGYWCEIVDDYLRPVAAGMEGELIIGGPGVGAGYLNRPDLTAEKFFQTSFPGSSGETERAYRSGDLCRVNAEGEIEFLGRIDTQVKIRGYRVELGEIEAVLMEDAAVSQAVVQLFHDPDGSEVLIGFLTPQRGAVIGLDRLRGTLKTRLPAYMHPRGYDICETLPTLISGKVDRKALRRPTNIELEQRQIAPPETPTEAALHEAWSQTFAPAPVSVDDDFFEELGGHSLRAAKMVSIARKNPALKMLSIQDLYAAPTIRALAIRMDKARLAGDTSAKVETPFHPVPQMRRTLCVIAQTIALVPIFAFAGLQWLTPYLVYTSMANDTVASRFPALALALATYVIMPPLMVLLSIAVKWIVVGRFKAGDYPLWGAYYFRWWFVRRFLSVIPTQFLTGTPLMATYYRALGAKIGKGAQLYLHNIDAPDLVSIGEHAILSDGTNLATTGVERGVLRLGMVTIGDRAFVGSMGVVGRDAVIGDGAVLEDLSMLPGGERIADGEVWTGSPAEKTDRQPDLSAPVNPSALRKLAVTTGLIVSALLLPLAAVLPIAPGLIAIIELDWATTGYGYIAITPILALIYVLAMCTLMVAVKWTVVGKVKPGTYSIWSAFYVRLWFVRQLGELALDLLHPLYATLYVRPWYIALGAKVGERAEISTATSVLPDLIEIGEESFIADGVVFGAPRARQGAIQLERTRIGKRTFVGNSALLPTGAQLGDEVLIGVLSKPPPGDAALAKGATWFGSPAIHLPRRQMAAVFDEGARFRPSKRLILTRLVIEYVRVTLSLTVFLSLFSVFLTLVGELSALEYGPLWILLTFPFLYMGFALAAGAFVLALKWLVVGRYKPTNKPLWSLFVWKTELVTSTYENLAVPLLLEPLRGTPWLNIYLRLMGCKIGKRVFTDTTDITEHDLVDVGDDAALNEDAGLQTHLFEDRIMKVSGLKIGARTTVGSLAIVLYDAVIEDDAQLGDLSVLMKGETLQSGTSWEGSPARPARQ
jgi:non-ribosomal peptide synthetase-like protein